MDITEYHTYWLDRRSEQKFIPGLFKKLNEYTQEFIQKTNDIPFDYQERALVGHLAQAACRCGCFTIQDYDVSHGKLSRRGKKTHYRPDLWLSAPVPGKDRQTCVFEVKGNWIPLDKDSEKLRELLKTRLNEAYHQLSEHMEPEAKYSCALVALRVSCARRKWKTFVGDSQSYINKIRELKKRMEEVLETGWDDAVNANFWSYIFLRYRTAKRLCEKEAGQLSPPTLGVIWVGFLRRTPLKSEKG